MKDLVRELNEADIDPATFDVLLSNEIDRRLKARFATSFLLLASTFTASSYLVIILNAAFSWGISEVAIIALIIETPIQLIALLYIIARNLFPNERTHTLTGEPAR